MSYPFFHCYHDSYRAKAVTSDNFAIHNSRSGSLSGLERFKEDEQMFWKMNAESVCRNYSSPVIARDVSSVSKNREAIVLASDKSDTDVLEELVPETKDCYMDPLYCQAKSRHNTCQTLIGTRENNVEESGPKSLKEFASVVEDSLNGEIKVGLDGLENDWLNTSGPKDKLTLLELDSAKGLIALREGFEIEYVEHD
ncbi:hypothetical protein REPUB_Repub04eG0061700 [Reevesia pubescens]